MHVLLVDDDVRMRAVMRRLLDAIGIRDVAEAGNGVEALAHLREQGANLVFTDLQMPQADGITLVRAMRLSGDKTPVIMVSAQEDAGLIITAIRAGVNNYLPKPVNPALLIEKIAQTMGLCNFDCPQAGAA